jgi:hypothetical protein
MFTIVTGRYNNETWEASLRYREKKKFACIYAPPTKLTEKIDLNSPVFVIEMNNSTNKIMGIGLIKNKLVTDKVYKVQEDSNCNRYIYIGEYHISREIINNLNPLLVYILDEILFKGYTHSKRGTGLSKIPEKVLNLEICEGLDIKKEIKNVFIHHFKDNLITKKNERELYERELYEREII